MKKFHLQSDYYFSRDRNFSLPFSNPKVRMEMSSLDLSIFSVACFVSLLLWKTRAEENSWQVIHVTQVTSCCAYPRGWKMSQDRCYGIWALRHDHPWDIVSWVSGAPIGKLDRFPLTFTLAGRGRRSTAKSTRGCGCQVLRFVALSGALIMLFVVSLLNKNGRRSALQHGESMWSMYFPFPLKRRSFPSAIPDGIQI